MAKIRWKGGALLFLVLSAIYILPNVVIEFLIYANEVTYAYIKGLGFILILKVLFPLGIFLLSLYKTEKKILDNTYTHGWLVRYNIGLTLILYAATALLLFAQLWPDMSGLGFAVIAIEARWIVPLLVAIFSFLPALIFYKFHSNQKVLRVFPYISLVSIFVLPVVILNTYYFKGADYAINAGDPFLCEKIDDVNQRNRCYSNIMYQISNLGVVEDCYKFPKNSKDGDLKTQCVADFARAHKDPEICDKAPQPLSCSLQLVR